MGMSGLPCQLADDGYSILAERLRTAGERAAVSEVLQLSMKVQVPRRSPRALTSRIGVAAGSKIQKESENVVQVVQALSPKMPCS